MECFGAVTTTLHLIRHGEATDHEAADPELSPLGVDSRSRSLLASPGSKPMRSSTAPSAGQWRRRASSASGSPSRPLRTPWSTTAHHFRRIGPTSRPDITLSSSACRSRNAMSWRPSARRRDRSTRPSRRGRPPRRRGHAQLRHRLVRPTRGSMRPVALARPEPGQRRPHNDHLQHRRRPSGRVPTRPDTSRHTRPKRRQLGRLGASASNGRTGVSMASVYR